MTDLIPEWKNIQGRGHNSVEWHSYQVLWLIIKDKKFRKYSAEDQNILKWAALLHDVMKRQTESFEGRDHVHPFESGLCVLRIFRRLGFMHDDLLEHYGHEVTIDDANFDRVEELISDSVNDPLPEAFEPEKCFPDWDPCKKYCR